MEEYNEGKNQAACFLVLCSSDPTKRLSVLFFAPTGSPLAAWQKTQQRVILVLCSSDPTNRLSVLFFAPTGSLAAWQGTQQRA